MDIGDEPVCTFPHFCGTTLLSPQRKFYLVVAQQGCTLFLQNTQIFSPNDFVRDFVSVEDMRMSGDGYKTKAIVHTLAGVDKTKAKNLVALMDVKVGAKLGRKSDTIADWWQNIHVCGMYEHSIVVAETRTVFLPSGAFVGTGWTVIKH